MSRKGELVSMQSVERLEKRSLQPQEHTEWLTAREAAEHLKIKTRTLLLWTRQGKIKGYALSGGRRHVWRYLRAELDAAVFGKPVLCSISPSVLVTKGVQ
ncbi:MAG TPA: helix-turn-helix domain-containing protein [Terriglobales bacterium]|jgi:excisionase family DNA binding protein|nr:helix-turn-helix domain-containing protein [Terriglobales bacterium]